MNIEINGNELNIDGVSVMLRPILMKVFNELHDASPKVVGIDALLYWLEVQMPHTVIQHVSQLRKALTVFENIEIVTHSKVGYQMKIKGEK